MGEPDAPAIDQPVAEVVVQPRAQSAIAGHVDQSGGPIVGQ